MSDKLTAFKEKVLKCVQEGDIATLFVMEQEAQELLGEEDLLGYYANILELSLENLTNALEHPKHFSLEEVQDFATLRALYEYAMEHYSAGSLNDAAALFEILEGLTSDEAFSQAMKLHYFSCNQGLVLDEFLETIADVDATEALGTFYISVFQGRAHHLLNIAEVSEGTV
jgi:hypothetical protein